INVARGGIIDEAALAAAIESGTIAGAALDVFAAEPTTESPLFGLDSVVVTPHLGASTAEAQDKAGDTIAEMVELALAGDFVPFAVNVSAGEAAESVRPYLGLAERLGAILAGLCGSDLGGGPAGSADSIEIEYQGQIAEHDTRILTLSVLKGFFGATSGEPVSYVNAPQVAEEQGIEVRPTATTTARDYVNLISLRSGQHSLAGTLVGLRAVPTVVMIDDHAVDVPPSDHLLIVRNEDRPGMIGTVGTVLGAASVNIADMAVGANEDGAKALMAIVTGDSVPDEVVAELRALDGITSVNAVG
ncbi:MAG TPA: NAD(P)-dependent oxidoreductase, partial [Microthrixaceae bacterium]|nr:NAD(P)-dependent oxidoreductase [Microthrixaceae bacterium]